MILLVILVDSSKFKSQKLTKIVRTVFSVVTIYSSIISQCLQSDVTIMLQNEMQQKKFSRYINVQAVTAKGHEQSLYSPATKYVEISLEKSGFAHLT